MAARGVQTAVVMYRFLQLVALGTLLTSAACAAAARPVATKSSVSAQVALVSMAASAAAAAPAEASEATPEAAAPEAPAVPAEAPAAPAEVPAAPVLGPEIFAALKGNGTVCLGEDGPDCDSDGTRIRKLVRRLLPRIDDCYNAALARTPGLAGQVIVQFTIEPGGNVGKVKANGFDGRVDACIEGVFRAATFFKPEEGRFVNVTYPISLSPATP